MSCDVQYWNLKTYWIDISTITRIRDCSAYTLNVLTTKVWKMFNQKVIKMVLTCKNTCGAVPTHAQNSHKTINPKTWDHKMRVFFHCLPIFEKTKINTYSRFDNCLKRYWIYLLTMRVTWYKKYVKRSSF